MKEKTKIKVFEYLETLGFKGVDASLETSLLEYCMLWREKDDSYQFILYKSDIEKWDTMWMDKESFISIIEEDWFELDKVLSYCDTTKEKFIADFPRSASDAANYWGNENVFGSSYSYSKLKKLLKLTK